MAGLITVPVRVACYARKEKSLAIARAPHPASRSAITQEGSVRWAAVKQWVGLVARLVVAGFLIVAGIAKFPDPAGNVRAVRAYQLLPEAVVPTVGHALPTVELIVGFLLSRDD